MTATIHRQQGDKRMWSVDLTDQGENARWLVGEMSRRPGTEQGAFSAAIEAAQQAIDELLDGTIAARQTAS